MKDEQRTAPPPRARPKAPTGAPRPGQGRSAAPVPAAPKPTTRRPTTAPRSKPPQPQRRDDYPREAYPPRPKQAPPKARAASYRREQERFYPGDDYYQKRPPIKTSPAAKRPGRPQKGKKKRTNPFYTFIYLVFAVVIALLLSFLLRTFVFEIVKVNGDAMYPTLLSGDWVLMTKFDYWSSQPRRGEIIAVNVSGKEEGVILRRVMAVPGETIEITSEGETIVDNRILDEQRYVKQRSFDAHGEISLGPGQYIVLADNRDNSQTQKIDSRKIDPETQEGILVPFPKKDILGRVRSIVWPPDRR